MSTVRTSGKIGQTDGVGEECPGCFCGRYGFDVVTFKPCVLRPRPLSVWKASDLLEARLCKFDRAVRSIRGCLEINTGSLRQRTDVIDHDATHALRRSCSRQRVRVENLRWKSMADVETLDAAIRAATYTIRVDSKEQAVLRARETGVEDLRQWRRGAGG